MNKPHPKTPTRYHERPMGAGLSLVWVKAWGLRLSPTQNHAPCIQWEGREGLGEGQISRYGRQLHKHVTLICLMTEEGP